MIDLHTHSIFSDGSRSPADLAREAGRIGLTALALTDHDSTAGLPEFMEACRAARNGPLGIPGVEISAEVDSGTMHILGYFMDCGHAALQSALAQIRDGRHIRNRKIVERLRALGMDLTLEEIAGHAGDEIVGRPHFAGAMIAKGYVASKQEAFDSYLAKGRPAYVDRFRFSPEDSIRTIARAGGVPVLAHPQTLGLNPRALRTLVGRLREMGLQGLEAYYSEHGPDAVKQYVNLARRLDLVVTGGSDYHGAMNPAIGLGVGFGSLRVPDELVEPLRARAATT